MAASSPHTRLDRIFGLAEAMPLLRNSEFVESNRQTCEAVRSSIPSRVFRMHEAQRNPRNSARRIGFYTEECSVVFIEVP